MQELRINLFGVFEARIHDVPVRMPTRRVELILALLALSPEKAFSRSHLAALLWPEQEDAQARASLRQALFRLRGALGTDHSRAIETTTGWVKLRRDAVVLDTDALDADDAPAADIPSGLPLDGLSGFEPEIEDLLDTARAELRRRLCDWHEAAAATALTERRFIDLEGHARARLAVEPYDEAALRDLMTALWRQGRRNAALAAFRQVSQRIRDDLSVSVEDQTTALYQTIRAAREKEPDTPRTPQARPDDTAPAEPETGATPTPPPPDSPFITHLRNLAVIHIRSERLRAALRDPDPENAEAGSQKAIRDIEVAVAREGGEIIGRAGHQLSAVFGAHRPDESPALSAALAGFEIARQDCAVGINAGTGLVGPQSATYPLAHVAQSLAEMARPGEVRVAPVVEAACRGAFVFSDVAPAPGPDSAPSWRLERETSARSGFDIRVARGLSRFGGRARELSALAEVADHHGPRVVAIMGEAGIGKSRLAHEFIRQYEPTTLMRVQFGRGEAGGGIACFRDMARALLRMESEPSATALPDILRERLGDPGIAETLQPAIAGLLGLAGPEQAWLDLSRNRRLQSLADALLTIIAARCDRKSVLLIEDTHWADDDAQLLVERLVLSLGAEGPMVIVTRRPGKAESWLGHETVRSLPLRPLDRREAEALLEGSPLPGNVRTAILERGDGVPLFLEELSRAATAAPDLFDAAPQSSLPAPAGSGIPIALRGILSYRIDALPAAARQTLEAAAILGAAPTDDLLAPLGGLRPDAYENALSTLADADLLYRIRTFPQRSYAFKHALVLDAAYQGIPASRRTALHAGVVRLRDELGHTSGLDDTVLAGHALRGNLPDRALDLAMRAAKDAATRSAYALANRMTDLALQAIEQLPPSDRLLREEAGILSWRRALLWPLGQKTRTVEGLKRAEAIATQLGDDRKLAEVCIHRAYIHTDDGQPQIGLEYAGKAEAAASRMGDARLVAEAILARCQTYALHGRMRAALQAIRPHETAWDQRRHVQDGLLVTRYVMLKFHTGRAHAALGDGAAAWRDIKGAAETAAETNRPVDRYIAMRGLADICVFSDAPEAAMQAYAAAREIGLRADTPAYVAWAEADLAELKLASGAFQEGLEELQAFLARADATLLQIAQIKARAAVACALRDEDKGSVRQLRKVLQDAESADMPIIRIKLLREMAARLKGHDDEKAAAATKAADAIQAEEGYTTAQLPAHARIGDLIDALGMDG
jgi:DNA-binding SARP family transcriptional activator